MTQEQNPAAALLDWLQKKTDRINELERLGRKAVAEGRQADYAAIMRQKAELLAGLEDEARPLLDKIDVDEAASYAERGLGAYSCNANRALEINSIFYMSALLFSDDHQPGQPHNLEIFRDELKRLLEV